MAEADIEPPRPFFWFEIRGGLAGILGKRVVALIEGLVRLKG